MRDPREFEYEEDNSLQLTVNSYRSSFLSPDSEGRSAVYRLNRADRHHVWEQMDLESGGQYGEYYKLLGERFPMLSQMELRVCSLIKGGLKNEQIGERLGIEMETVGSHRNHIRRKLGLSKENMVPFLAEI